MVNLRRVIVLLGLFFCFVGIASAQNGHVPIDLVFTKIVDSAALVTPKKADHTVPLVKNGVSCKQVS